MTGFFSDWKRRRILARHQIPEEVWAKGLELLPLLDTLDEIERRKLREVATLFLHEKHFEGGSGFTVEPTHKIVIALLACLPVLELGLDALAGWSSIVVYKDEFKNHEEWVDEQGIAHVDRSAQAGQTVPGGPLLLSWADVVQSAEDPYDGYNVVIHEVAHKLDMLNGGEADGIPPLHPDMDAAAFKAVFSKSFDDLCHRLDLGEESGIDEYATENESEFFAVMVETFFEAPDIVETEYPAVYEQLMLLFRQDPLRRLPAPEEPDPEHQ